MPNFSTIINTPDADRPGEPSIAKLMLTEDDGLTALWTLPDPPSWSMKIREDWADEYRATTTGPDYYPAGATATNTDGIITIVFDEPVDSIVYSKLSAQVRTYDIAVYAKAEEEDVIPPCEHTDTEVVDAVDSTCAAEGHTGRTVCLACGETLDAGKAIAKKAHSFGEWMQTVAPAIGANGEERRDCANCDHFETREVVMGLYLSQFIAAVENLSEDASAEVQYGELCEALALYRKLTEDEKAAASESYAILEDAVAAYNTAADTANGELMEATRVAFLPIGTTFVFLGALLLLIRRKLML